jgi:hypothetical protein
MIRTMAIRGLLVAIAFVTSTPAASAQVFGTFTWQMQPYCNRVTLTLTSVAGHFTLDGSDEQCGATTKASANGIGVFNPDGTVGINFTIVTSPSGKPVHVSALVSPANGQGTWTDSVGNSGPFAFFGAVPGLPVRPLPASGVAPAAITALEIGPAAIGASEIAAGAVASAALGTITRRSAVSVAMAPGAAGNVGVQCLAGERVLSGGNDTTHFMNVVIVASRDDGASGWRVFARNNDGVNAHAVTVHAYCLAP